MQSTSKPKRLPDSLLHNLRDRIPAWKEKDPVTCYGVTTDQVEAMVEELILRREIEGMR